MRQASTRGCGQVPSNRWLVGQGGLQQQIALQGKEQEQNRSRNPENKPPPGDQVESRGVPAAVDPTEEISFRGHARALPAGGFQVMALSHTWMILPLFVGAVLPLFDVLRLCYSHVAMSGCLRV